VKPKADRKIPDLVSLAEAGEILGMSKQAAHKRLMRGELPGRQVGTTWVFRRALVEKIRDEEAEGA
jgi:hypothetical protein